MLNEAQAYAAMVRFLESFYERGRSEDIGMLLGGLALLPDGRPADPAFEADWHAAVDIALAKDASRQELRALPE
ncbi:MAG: hypothetical protein ACRD1M_13290 [Terriglobales bacterium]